MAIGPCCCRCNKKGRCAACACVKAGRACSSCLPMDDGRCGNHFLPAAAFGLSITANSPRATTTTVHLSVLPFDDHGRPSLIGTGRPLSSSHVPLTAHSVSNGVAFETSGPVTDLESPSCHPPLCLPDFSPLPDPVFRWGDSRWRLLVRTNEAVL